MPEWESSIDETTGQLLFIDCHPVVTQNINELKSSPFTKTQNRKSTRGKFLRLIRRRDSKRRSKRLNKQENTETNKVTFQDFQEGEVKQVELKIDPTKVIRKGVLVESLLGLSVSPFSDGRRVMISGFTLNSEAKNEKSIKIGDWLKKVNNIEVTMQDLNRVIEQHAYRSEILLELQRVAGVEVTKDPPTNELSNQSKFVKQLTNFDTEESDSLNSVLCEQPIGILYINTEQLSESGPEYEGVVYCYPRPYETNPLCASRGVFITLNHLLHETTKTKPLVTTVFCKKLCHVTYKTFSNNILLLLLPDNRISLNEIIILKTQLIRLLEFTYQTIDKCFEEKNQQQLDHFFSRFFARILSSGLWSKAEQYVDLKDIPIKAEKTSRMHFEESLLGSIQLNLPNEAQMQIDDALFELEASDYREWVS